MNKKTVYKRIGDILERNAYKSAKKRKGLIGAQKLPKALKDKK
ncbi:hypothetical protein [Paenibacillus nuruki]|nr:hypothetical protein [Paenibacillus nuruki]